MKKEEMNVHLFTQLQEENIDANMIDILGLTDFQVWQVVKEWYTNGMIPDILQNEFGNDLEEICERVIDKMHKEYETSK